MMDPILEGALNDLLEKQEKLADLISEGIDSSIGSRENIVGLSESIANDLTNIVSYVS